MAIQRRRATRTFLTRARGAAGARPDPVGKLKNTTVDWSRPREPFEGLRDWRLHFAVLTVFTVAIYTWLW